MNFGADRTPQCTASYAGYSTPRGLVWDTNMAAVSLFWDTNMAAVTSCEKTLYVCDVGHASQRSVQKSTIKTRTLSSAQKTKKHTCSCLIVMRSCQSKKKTGSRGTGSVLPSFGPIPSFNYSNYPVDYPSIYPAQRRAFRES